MGKPKSKQEILSKEFITRSDVQVLFGIGVKKAQAVFDKVQQATIEDGKLVIKGKVSLRRTYKMLGLPVPTMLDLSSERRCM